MPTENTQNQRQQENESKSRNEMYEYIGFFFLALTACVIYATCKSF